MNKVQVFEISGCRQENALSDYKAVETASQFPLKQLSAQEVGARWRCVSLWKVQRGLIIETLLLTESHLEELCSASIWDLMNEFA